MSVQLMPPLLRLGSARRTDADQHRDRRAQDRHPDRHERDRRPGTRARRAGRRGGRCACGTAATPSPRIRPAGRRRVPIVSGSISEPSSAPPSVPRFQHTNKVSPVSQNAAACSRRVVWAVAIAVVSSITRWAAPSRRRQRTVEHAGHRQPVDPVAGGEQQRAAERGRRRTTVGDDADGAELRRAGEHQRRHHARLQHRRLRRRPR